MTLEPGESLTRRVTVVPANRASWDDLQAVLGTRGYAALCQCQRFKIGKPVGWCAVEPRIAYPRLLRTRGWRKGRDEDPQDDSVWAVTCFITRVGYRRRGVTYALARAAVDFARERGARAIEGYPMITEPHKEISWGELHVGSHWRSPMRGSPRSAGPACGAS